MTTKRRGYLALADGTLFEGWVFGASASAAGETVFTTGMSGYQEVLSDPSYTGQLVTMTAPQIGNTGVNAADNESVNGKPQVAGFIVRDNSTVVSNYRSDASLHEYLERNAIVAIEGVDTRRLTRLLRDKGSQNGCIGAESPDVLVERARQAPNMEGLDLVQRVTPKQSYTFEEGRGPWGAAFSPPGRADPPAPTGNDRPHVVAMDLGAKKNILRCLVDIGARVTCVPASTTAEEILALTPDGIFLSNGPGDPAALDYIVETVGQLLGKKPIFGICLGHQLLARALGATTYKLKFGHRGLNQPVKDLVTGRVEITSQNHGFVVDVGSIPAVARSSHIHLNDGTSEGLVAEEANAFSVQYHPEAAAGPHDALYLFQRFSSSMQQ